MQRRNAGRPREAGRGEGTGVKTLAWSGFPLPILPYFFNWQLRTVPHVVASVLPTSTGTNLSPWTCKFWASFFDSFQSPVQNRTYFCSVLTKPTLHSVCLARLSSLQSPCTFLWSCLLCSAPTLLQIVNEITPLSSASSSSISSALQLVDPCAAFFLSYRGGL